MTILRISIKCAGLAPLAASVALGVCQPALSSESRNAPVSVSERLQTVYSSMNRVHDLSPDGKMLAYATRAVGFPYVGEVSFWVKPVEEGAAVRLPGAIPMKLAYWGGTEARTRWSPNGRYLAYFAVEGDKYYLHIWDRRKRQAKVFRDTAACATYYCATYDLQWSPDSAKVYFLSETPAVAATGRYDFARNLDNKAKARRELLVSDPEHDGVTVRSYPPAAGQGENSDDDSKVPLPIVDVSVADVNSNRAAMIFSGAPAQRINLSPDGKSLIVAAMESRSSKSFQSYFDLYLIDASKKPARSRPRSSPGGVYGSRGEPLKPLAHKVKLWGPRIAWSPQSDRIAYASQGPLTTGDVFVLDIKTGETINASEKVSIPDVDISSPERTAPAGGKFGDPFRSVVWSADGAYIYALHGGNLYDYAYEPEKARVYQIWKIAAQSGESIRLAPDADIEFHHILNKDGVMTPGRADNRLVFTGRPAGEGNGVYEIDVDSGELYSLSTFPGSAFQSLPGRVTRALQGGRMAFINERVDAPEEIMVFDLNDGRLFQATSINDFYRDNINHTRRVVRWSTAEGEESQGMLYVPNTATGDKPAPLLMHVYSGAKFTEREKNAYEGRVDNLLYPLDELLKAGYAVLQPDFPIVGGGESCDGVGRHAVASLGAAGRLASVDADRAVVYGFSFGGWSVKCILTQTDRFKAGIGTAGVSNMLSFRFSYASGRVLNANGGQTAINRTVWDDPAAFWAESPVGQADKVVTPLLLLHGKEDSTVPFEQSVEMYIALSDLEKTVTLVGYDGADHSTVVDYPDYRKRIIEWVERYAGRP